MTQRLTAGQRISTYDDYDIRHTIQITDIAVLKSGERRVTFEREDGTRDWGWVNGFFGDPDCVWDVENPDMPLCYTTKEC